MKQQQSLKRILVAAAAITFAAAMIYAFRPQAIPADFATVSPGPFVLSVREEGYTRVREVYRVSAPVSGRLVRSDLHPGDAVRAGETVVVRLLPGDPSLLDHRVRSQAQAMVSSAEAALSLANSEVSKAQAQLAFNATELKRMRRLAAERTVSPAELDRAELARRTALAALEASRAMVRVREAELQNARAVLNSPTADDDQAIVALRAPIDGTILRVLQESESVVQAGTALLELGDPQDLEIVVEMLSTDAVRIATGSRCDIQQWGGPHPLTGRVRRVEPFGFTKVSALGIEEQRVRVLVDLVGDPALWRALGHGFRVEAQVVLWEEPEVLQTPTSALFRQGGAWAVFRVVAGRAVLTPVEIGHNNGRAAQVLAGLNAGDQVILHPSERVSDGHRLQVRE